MIKPTPRRSAHMLSVVLALHIAIVSTGFQPPVDLCDRVSSDLCCQHVIHLHLTRSSKSATRSATFRTIILAYYYILAIHLTFSKFKKVANFKKEIPGGKLGHQCIFFWSWSRAPNHTGCAPLRHETLEGTMPHVAELCCPKTNRFWLELVVVGTGWTSKKINHPWWTLFYAFLTKDWSAAA